MARKTISNLVRCCRLHPAMPFRVHPVPFDKQAPEDMLQELERQKVRRCVISHSGERN